MGSTSCARKWESKLDRQSAEIWTKINCAVTVTRARAVTERVRGKELACRAKASIQQDFVQASHVGERHETRCATRLASWAGERASHFEKSDADDGRVR